MAHFLLDVCTPLAHYDFAAAKIGWAVRAWPGLLERGMFNAGTYLITIAELPSFCDDSSSVFTEEEYNNLINYLAEYPDAGDVIPGTGGIRKVRWPAKGQGKRGGARVIYYFRDLNMPVYMLAVYAKGEKINLTEREKKVMRDMVELIVEARSARRFVVVKSA